MRADEGADGAAAMPTATRAGSSDATPTRPRKPDSEEKTTATAVVPAATLAHGQPARSLDYRLSDRAPALIGAAVATTGVEPAT